MPDEQSMQITTVRPRLVEWLSLPLIVPAVVFGVYILASMVGVGAQPALAVWIGLPLSVVLIGGAIWRIGQQSYWQLDGEGITWGRWSPTRVLWPEIEALFIGMPDEMSGVGATLARLPVVGAAQSVAQIRAWRQTALVLRLRGRRLLVIGLGGVHFRGGAVLRDRLRARLAALTVDPTQYTGEERHALAAHFVSSQLIRLG